MSPYRESDGQNAQQADAINPPVAAFTQDIESHFFWQRPKGHLRGLSIPFNRISLWNPSAADDSHGFHSSWVVHIAERDILSQRRLRTVAGLATANGHFGRGQPHGAGPVAKAQLTPAVNQDQRPLAFFPSRKRAGYLPRIAASRLRVTRAVSL